MSAVIGLAVASDELRVVLMRDGVVRWAGRAGRGNESVLADQIASLLADAPIAHWNRPRVIAAVGPAAAQVKRLAGLPPLESRRALESLVREGVGRFFLRNGIPLQTTGVRLVEPGVVWAAAFERPMLGEIDRGVRAAGLRLCAIVPAVVALAAALPDTPAEWRDGDVRTEFVVQAGAIASVRRIVAAENEAAIPPPAIPSLGSLGEEGWRFADAYGAALSSPANAMAIRPSGQDEAAVSRRRLLAAAATAALTAMLAVAAPAGINVLQHARTSRQLALLAPRAHDAAVVEHELQRMSRALAEVGSFSACCRSPTALLAALSRALPNGAALVTLHVDSAGGTIVFLAPRAARAIAALDSVPGIAAPEVLGPVTKEVVGLREVERATVRFRLVVDPAP